MTNFRKNYLVKYSRPAVDMTDVETCFDQSWHCFIWPDQSCDPFEIKDRETLSKYTSDQFLLLSCDPMPSKKFSLTNKPKNQP